MAILSYVFIFSSCCCSVILQLFPGSVTYKAFALIVAVIGSVYVVRYVLLNKWCVSRTFLGVLGFLILFAIAYKVITPKLYGYNFGGMYDSEFLAFVGQVIPGALLAVIVGENVRTQECIVNISLFVSIIFGFVAMVCTFFPSTTTSGGLALNDNNLNYQSLSYLSTYSAALAEAYLFVNGNSSLKLSKVIASIMVTLDLLTVLIAGGRGGFVAFVLFLILYLYLSIRHASLDINAVLKYLLIGILGIATLFLIVRFAAKVDIASSGYKRIINFLNGAGDSNRNALWKAGLTSFLDSPLWGHGIGSAWYEVGYYSHNIFVDLLCETGIIGTSIFIVITIQFLRNIIRETKRDRRNIFWLFIFLCGFIENLFSGYYMVTLPLWWSIILGISKDVDGKNNISLMHQTN